MNSRLHAPKEILGIFCTNLWRFPLFSARFYFLFDTLVSTVSACSAPVCGNECGQKRFPVRAGDVSPVPGRKRFCVGFTRFRAVVRRRPAPSAYLGAADRHKTFCGTSSRSSGSCPLRDGPAHPSSMHRHTLHRQSFGEVLPSDEWRACAACDSNCDLCSIVITP